MHDVTSPSPQPPPRLIRFGVFEVDPSARELRKKGARQRLQQQPFDLLMVLLDHPGRIVTREDLRQALWPADVYVDFDRGLNRAMVKLRDALGDSFDSPIYIETLPRIGYRFIAVLEPITPQLAADTPSVDSGVTSTTPSPVVGSRSAASAVFGIRPRPNWRVVFAFVLVACATALFAFWYRGNRAVAAPAVVRSVAILPLDNFSGDSKQDYFADGVTDELTTLLAKNSNLRVTSRASTIQYKGEHKPLRDIARELGVDAIIDGSVARKGDAVHLNLQLIGAFNDVHIWAETYDRNFADITNLSDEATKSIAAKVNSSATPPSSLKHVDPEAHDAYLRGLYAWFNGDDDASANYFKKAMQIQPDYALSWVGQSITWGAAVDNQHVAPLVGLPKMKAAAVKAVELDPDSAEAHQALAAAYYWADWNFPSAERESARAIQLNPAFSEALHLRSYILIALHQYNDAVENQKRAIQIDPFSRPHAMARIYAWVRRYDDAERDAKWRLVSMPNDSGLQRQLEYIYRCEGRYKESVDELVSVLSGSPFAKQAEPTRKAFERGGYSAVLRYRLAILTDLPADKYTSPYSLAVMTAQLGDSERERTLDLLEDAVRKHDIRVLVIQTDPAFDHLHSDPRYRAVIRAIGLTPAY